MIKLEEILASLPENVYWKDKHSIYLGCNPAFAKFLKLDSCNEIIGKADKDFFSAETSTKILETDQRVLKNNKVFAGEESVTTCQGNSIMLLSKKAPLFDDNNCIIGIVGVFININYLKHYEENFLSLFPGHIYWKDIDGVYLGCNDEHAKSLGLKSKHEIIGKTDFDLVWQEHAEVLRQLDKKVMVHDKAYIEEENLLLVDGEKTIYLSKKMPFKNELGNTVGIIGTSIDITQRKNQEKLLEQALLNAEKANKAKSEFIANMSHDIRVPLTGILGLAQVLKTRAKHPLDYEDAQLLIGATEQLLTLLNEIIEIVRIETDQTINDQEDFDLFTLVENNIELLKPVLREKNLKLDYQTSSEVPRYLFGNRIYLNRILLNLLSNAIKFTDHGCVSIEIVMKEKIEAQEKVIIQIIIDDTGVGIPQDKLKEIFEYFSRLSPSYKGRYKGYGLGLYTVKQYLKIMQGEITVESELGKGSHFVVTLPFVIGKEIENKTSHVFEPPALLQTIGKISGQAQARLLLVEDDFLAARMALQLLKMNGCEAIHANSGNAALQIAKMEPFDLIIMDIGLPDMSGFEVIKRIRELPNVNATTPIIALTGHMANDKKQECFDAGAQEIFIKPLTQMATQIFLTKYNLRKPLELPIIDLEDSMSIAGGNSAAVKEVLDLLVISLPKDYQVIQEAYNAQDYEAMYQRIHKLYGGLCYCGTPRLREAVKLLQQTLSEGKKEKLPVLVASLRKEIDAVLQKYQTLS